MGNVLFEVDLKIDFPYGDFTAEEITDVFKALVRDMMNDAAIATDISFTKADEEEFSVSGFAMGYDHMAADYSYIKGWCP